MTYTEAPDFLDQLPLIRGRTGENKLELTKSLARRILPNNFKNFLRDIVYKPPRLPFEQPHEVNIEGVCAKFHIETMADYYRLVRKGHEGPFSNEIIRSLKSRGGHSVIWDIGAAQGIYSILAAIIGASVVAIEPNPYGVTELKRNAKLNGPQVERNIKILSLALGRFTGTADLLVSPGQSYAALTNNFKSQTEKIVTQIIPGDDIIDLFLVEPPNVVKIDVEGAEGDVVDGMNCLLTSEGKPRDVFIELHPRFLKSFGTCTEEVCAKMVHLGYKPESGWKRSEEILVHFQKND